MKLIAKVFLASIIGAVALASAFAGGARAGFDVSFSYQSGPADVRVWLVNEYGDEVYDNYYDDEYDVYPSAADVAVYVRASRNTHAAVYVVDTEGFLHVIHPVSPYASQFLRGGRVYRFDLVDTGFCDYGFDRGVAYAYAVTSPVPFRFDAYGWGIFGANYGFRIYGDPYVASREFYVSILPGHCDVTYVNIGYARFYVREYVRYPSYLCVGWHGGYCRGNCEISRHYHVHSNDPYRVLRSKYKLKSSVIASAKITRLPENDWRPAPNRVASRTVAKTDRRIVPIQRREVSKVTKNSRTPSIIASARPKTVRTTPVVRSSKTSVIEGKRDISQLRKQLERRNTPVTPRVQDRDAAPRSGVGGKASSVRKSGVKRAAPRSSADADHGASKTKHDSGKKKAKGASKKSTGKKEKGRAR